eukprot:CAMPEP_0174752690 /NCGR_PEP_ID=MMETSP1094-20130205/102571_1 /TAXON_ID=156173 /ORGANISM="Chrysochromulina brevifilum, Strain UTEX LB 985" /LENGTH=104 /DNA_ID=CAMNT_0015958365 /DNA_START=64 /DNA_END=377 /DNA_ORIENTATION=-
MSAERCTSAWRLASASLRSTSAAFRSRIRNTTRLAARLRAAAANQSSRAGARALFYPQPVSLPDRKHAPLCILDRLGACAQLPDGFGRACYPCRRLAAVLEEGA